LTLESRTWNRERLVAFFDRFPNVTLEFHTLDEAWFQSLPLIFRGGVSAYARLAMGELLKIPKVIYLDVDILVQCNVRELWGTPLCGDIVMAVADRYVSFECLASKEETKRYNCFNSGVLLLDLDAYRAAEVFPQALRLLATHGHLLKTADQALLNYICRGRAGEISAKWNTMGDTTRFAPHL
jgi:lipopolysaccharide biosynthesis glycosyltransferase